MEATSLKTRLTKFATSGVTISIFLFVLAFAPRLWNLDQFLTPDEFLWVDRSRNFLAGLTSDTFRCTTDVTGWEYAAGLACTLRTGHPGVTTMWTGSFGLWLVWLAEGRGAPLHDFVAGLSTNPLDPVLIAPARIATVLITSLWVVALYWLLRRLIGGRVALLTALLVALSPFHIGLSRVIHHDALSTTFMTLSALLALVYWGQDEGRRWLLASGALAGLGFLSKSPAMFLMPYIALVGLWFTVAQVRQAERGTGRFWPTLTNRLLRRTIPDGLLWFAVAIAVVFAAWPAMWVIPRQALEVVFFIGAKYATGGHAKGNFFLGEISNDPGALFYPVTWLFRVSPLVVLGVIVTLAAWPLFSGPRRPAQNSAAAGDIRALYRYLPLVLLFVAGYYLLMTIGEKKQDRYFLPAYPWLELVAAGGLVILIDAVASLIKWRQAAARYALLVLLVLLSSGYFVLDNYPYYFTYYSPLMGGPQAAVKSVTVGWGEGLDQAAAFLNVQQNPMGNRVSSWYESTFAPYYYGPSISYAKEKGKALAGDYVIFYINQVQRRFPDDIIFEYFDSRTPPTQVISLKGIDYAWIYPSLSIDHYVQDQVYTGIAALLAWQWPGGDRPFYPGESVPFELFWEYLGKQQEEPFFFRLVDVQGRPWAEGLSAQPRGVGLNPPPEAWREGEMLYERGVLQLPPDLPPGQYRLQIGFYTNAPAVTEGELLFTLPEGEDIIYVDSRPLPNYVLPPVAAPVNQPLGDSLTLLGVALPPEPVAAGDSLAVETFWRIGQPLRADAPLHVGLMDAANDAQQAWFNLSLAETFNASLTTWQPGDIIHTRWQLDLLPETPPGQYRLELVLPSNPDQTLSAGNVTVTANPQ